MVAVAVAGAVAGAAGAAAAAVVVVVVFVMNYVFCWGLDIHGWFLCFVYLQAELFDFTSWGKST